MNNTCSVSHWSLQSGGPDIKSPKSIHVKLCGCAVKETSKMLRENDGRGCPILDREGRLTAGMTFELRLKKGEKSLLCKETGQDFIQAE